MLCRSARETAAAVNSAGDPVEVVDAYIARIIEMNPRLNALVRFDPQIAQREALDVRRRRNAGEAMPLAGVPVIVKDNIWVAGRSISQGSRLFAEHLASEDAIAVARLRQAGAVIIGIGNSPCTSLLPACLAHSGKGYKHQAAGRRACPLFPRKADIVCISGFRPASANTNRRPAHDWRMQVPLDNLRVL